MPIGKIIEIEGTDGSGKETQSYLLAENLKRLGIDAEVVSFPDYNSVSSDPVKLFLDGRFGTRDELTFMEISMLYSFDRSYTVRKLNLKEKIKKGTWIILDRYVGSNIIYQTVDLNENDFISAYTKIEKLEYGMLDLPHPDQVIYLNLPREISKKLIDERNNPKDINEIDDDFLLKVSTHGLWCARIMGWDIIDCYNETYRLDDIGNIQYNIKPKDEIATIIFRSICTKLLKMELGDE